MPLRQREARQGDKVQTVPYEGWVNYRAGAHLSL